jgi:hypothetical protein
MRIADCGLRIADCGLRIADCGLRIADCGLRIADCELRIANCELRREWKLAGEMGDKLWVICVAGRGEESQTNLFLILELLRSWWGWHGI